MRTNRLTSAQRSLQAREANAIRLSKYDARTLTEAAREKANQRFYDQVDPDRTLSPDERERRMREARRAHMLGLALKSSQVRGERKRNRRPNAQ